MIRNGLVVTDKKVLERTIKKYHIFLGKYIHNYDPYRDSICKDSDSFKVMKKALRSGGFSLHEVDTLNTKFKFRDAKQVLEEHPVICKMLIDLSYCIEGYVFLESYVKGCVVEIHFERGKVWVESPNLFFDSFDISDIYKWGGLSSEDIASYEVIQ